MADSGFNTFNRDYYSENWIDNNSWEKRKIYDNTPFLVMPSKKFNIKLNNLLPNFYCYVRVSAEQFGDRVAFPLSGFRINFYLYDNNSNLVFRDIAVINNLSLGEIKYEWKPLDIQSEGNYYCELEFVDEASGKSFTLPDNKNRLEIIVSK